MAAFVPSLAVSSLASTMSMRCRSSSTGIAALALGVAPRPREKIWATLQNNQQSTLYPIVILLFCSRVRIGWLAAPIHCLGC